MRLRGVLLLALLATGPALAVEQARTPADLKRIQDEIAATEKKRAETEAERAKVDAEIVTLQSESVAIASEVQGLERDLTLADNRIVELETREFAFTKSLATRRDRIAPLLGALQRLRRDPPPALAVAPDDAVAAARGAMLIASVAEKLESEARALSNDLKALAEVRTALVTERDAALTRQDEIDARRKELAGLIERRQQMVDELNQGVTDALDRIQQLEANVSDMNDLLVWLDNNPVTAPSTTSATGVVTVSSAKSQASFAASRGKISWPAAGSVTARFGDRRPDGIEAPGITLKTRSEAQVTAPADGEIVFAGPFGDYGRLLILEPAKGYFILIGGFGRLDAAVGQHVLKGEPLGVMAAQGGAGEAQMYIELRRDGVPVDPLQWFAPAEANG